MSVDKEGTHSSEFSTGNVQMFVNKEGTHSSEFSIGNIQMSVNKEGTHCSEFSTGHVQMFVNKAGTHSSEISTENVQMSVDKEGIHSSEFSTGHVQMGVDSTSIAFHRPANTDNSKMVIILAHNTSLDNKANVSDSTVLESSPCINGESFSQDSGKCELVVGNIEVSNGNLTNEPGNTVEKKCLKEFVEDIVESVNGDNSKRTKFEIKVKELKLELDDFVSRKRNETISTRSKELEIISRLYLYLHFFRRHDEIPCYAIREYYFSDNIYPVVDGYDNEEFRAILEYILASIGRRGVVSEFIIQLIEYMSRRRNGGVIPLYSIQDLPMPALLYRESDLFLSTSALLPNLQPQQPSENEDQNIVSLHLFRESTDPFNRIYRHQQELNTHRYANTNAARSENENGNEEENSVSTVFQPVTESHQENHSSTYQTADTETCAIETHATDTHVKVPESRPTCECAFGAAAACTCNRTEQALLDGSHLSVDANLSNPETEQVHNLERYNSSGSPKYMEYLDETRRLLSFDSAPCTIRLKKLQLMQAGFFYTGQGQVVCFHCGGCLEIWQAGDVPLHEHRQHFPYCRFVQTLMGTDLFASFANKMILR